MRGPAVLACLHGDLAASLGDGSLVKSLRPSRCWPVIVFHSDYAANAAVRDLIHAKRYNTLLLSVFRPPLHFMQIHGVVPPPRKSNLFGRHLRLTDCRRALPLQNSAIVLPALRRRRDPSSHRCSPLKVDHQAAVGPIDFLDADSVPKACCAVRRRSRAFFVRTSHESLNGTARTRKRAVGADCGAAARHTGALAVPRYRKTVPPCAFRSIEQDLFVFGSALQAPPWSDLRTHADGAIRPAGRQHVLISFAD